MSDTINSTSRKIKPAMPQPFVNELRLDLQASGGINPFTQHDSGSREQMLGGHLSQALVIDGADTRRCLTGIEREFGKATFNVKMPVNAEIIRVVEKFPRTLGRQSIKENSLFTVIFEDVETKCVDVLHLPRFHCRHQHFGFRYKFKAAANRLVAGALIPKGTILADSPSIDDLGNYRLGVETNVAFMSVPGIIEDGVIVSESYAKKLISRGFESRDASWGEHYYPLNLYGTEEEYKPFPDIGDKIRDDGLLFALRRYDDLLGPIEMTPKALREVDYTFDRCTWAEPGARVVDVDVLHDVRRNPPDTPVGMEAQTQRYYQAEALYYQTLLDIQADLKRKRKESLNISNKLHALLVKALSYKPDPTKTKTPQMYQLQPLDDWRVEVTFEMEVVPTVGFKLTDFHGGKGVICAVWKDEDMPLDQEGNRADCIMDGTATIKRMNIGRMYEHYINATSRTVTNAVRVMMAQDKSQATYQKAWEYLLAYYKIVSPKMYDLITGPGYTKSPQAHVEDIVKDGVYLWIPTDNPVNDPVMIEELMAAYPIHIGPITYRGRSGNWVTTKVPVLIASLYVMLLEKTSTYDWSGVASAKLQHFGIPARLTRFDKYSTPGRPQPVRISGESEVRLFAATIGGHATANMLDMSNNPVSHKAVVTNILRAAQPTRIQQVIDRKEVPLGNSRNLLFIGHSLRCAGVEFFYSDVETIPMVTYPPNEE